MKRSVLLSVAVMVGWFGVVSASQAQIFIRAPFVRVGVGDGVYVRAPFVNLYIPPGPPVVYMPPTMPPAWQAPIPQPMPAPQPMPPAAQPLPPAPNGPPAPLQPVQAPTLEAFSKSFQPKVGSYEVTIINPVTNQPTAVRFMLPEGSPRRVTVSRDSIEFFYRVGQWVRIEFDREGAKVTLR